MIGPAEIEDMRLDLAAAADRARLYDVAVATLDRHWNDRDAGAVDHADTIRHLVFAHADDRPLSDWKAVVSEATDAAGFHVSWRGDDVVGLEARPTPQA